MKSIGIFPGSGGLGGSTYEHLRKLLPSDQIILIIRFPEKVPREHIENGVRVRKASYESSPSDLEAAFAGVEVLFLISYPSHVHDYRRKVQLPAVDAARRAGVKHIFYSSLAFAGDYQDSSLAEVMQAHLDTERYLTDAAAADPSFTFTSVRQGLYSESYPIYTSFFDLSAPSAAAATGDDWGEILIPHDGSGPGVAWVKRSELGEATARLMANYSWDPDQFPYVNKKILLTGSRVWSLEETVRVLGEVAGAGAGAGAGAAAAGAKDGNADVNGLRVRRIGVDEYVKLPQVVSRFGSEERARTWATAWDAIRVGETAVVTGHLRDILGREPEPFDVTIRRLKQQ